MLELYSQQLDFRQGVGRNEHRSVQVVHEDANKTDNTAENSSAKSIDINCKSFKKDIKRVKSQGKKFKLLDDVIEILLEQKKIPDKYHAHKLVGHYTGYWELHIQPDWLLIYKITNECLYLVRTGSHAEVFT